MADLAAQSSIGVEQSMRVEDYLNDQLQSATDLENLDSLLENIQKQHTLLKEQVRGPVIRTLHDMTDDLSFEKLN